MKKILFVSSWNIFNERTWSGTPYGIYSALSKKTAVEILHTSRKKSNLFVTIFEKIQNQITMGRFSLKHGTKILNHTSQCKDLPCIVFSEFNSNFASNFYCYQDLSVDFVLRDTNYAQMRSSKFVSKSQANRKRKEALIFYKNCAGIFTMSNWLREDLIKNTGIDANKVHHVGGGCNVDISKINYKQKEGNKFIFVGRDWARKNGELVVEAFKSLALRLPQYNAQLYIAGPSSCPQSIQGNNNIHFLGNLSADELYKYYNLCDYFVMPSNFEAYGLVFGEALSFGLPCIGKNCYAMPEFIKDGKNGYLIQNSDAQELTVKMERLLVDGASMAKEVQNNRESYISLYSWDSVASKITEIIKKDGYDL